MAKDELRNQVCLVREIDFAGTPGLIVQACPDSLYYRHDRWSGELYTEFRSEFVCFSQKELGLEWPKFCDEMNELRKLLKEEEFLQELPTVVPVKLSGNIYMRDVDIAKRVYNHSPTPNSKWAHGLTGGSSSEEVVVGTKTVKAHNVCGYLYGEDRVPEPKYSSPPDTFQRCPGGDGYSTIVTGRSYVEISWLDTTK